MSVVTEASTVVESHGQAKIDVDKTQSENKTSRSSGGNTVLLSISEAHAWALLRLTAKGAPKRLASLVTNWSDD